MLLQAERVDSKSKYRLSININNLEKAIREVIKTEDSSILEEKKRIALAVNKVIQL